MMLHGLLLSGGNKFVKMIDLGTRCTDLGIKRETKTTCKRIVQTPLPESFVLVNKQSFEMIHQSIPFLD